MKTILLCPVSKAIKKRSQRRKHCALAVVRRSQKFHLAPPQIPFPGARDGQNSISWRWSLPLPKNLFGEDRCTQFRVIVVTDPHTHPQTPPACPPVANRQNRLQYTAPQLAQCNQVTANVSAQWRNVSHRARPEVLNTARCPWAGVFCLISRHARVHDFRAVYFARA